jgi:hypothetical protein
MYEPLAGQAGIAVITVKVIELLKRSERFRWLTCDSERLNRKVGMIVAAITSMGITSTVVGDWTWTSGATVTINLPPMSVLFEAVTRFATQYGMQQIVYRQTIAPVPAAEKKEPLVIAGRAVI